MEITYLRQLPTMGCFLRSDSIYTFQEPTFSWRDPKAILGARVARSSRFANFGSKDSILREVSP